MPTLLKRHGRWAGALFLIAAFTACPAQDRVEQEDRAEIGAEYEDAGVLADLNGHLAASIDAAEVAQERATHPDVRQFAQTLEQDHRQKQEQIASIMREHGLTGVEPDRTGDIESHQDDVRDLRDRERGEDFDRAYLDKAVEYHRTMLDRIDTAIDRTERAEFRQSLQGIRPGIEQHLRQGEQLRERLDNGDHTQHQ